MEVKGHALDGWVSPKVRLPHPRVAASPQQRPGRKQTHFPGGTRAQKR